MTKETLHLGEEKGEGKTKTKSPETLPVRKERSEVGYCHILKPAIILSFFQSHREACRILVPPPGIEPVSPAVEAWSLNHWSSREVPVPLSFNFNLLYVDIFITFCSLHITLYSDEH